MFCQQKVHLQLITTFNFYYWTLRCDAVLSSLVSVLHNVSFYCVENSSTNSHNSAFVNWSTVTGSLSIVARSSHVLCYIYSALIGHSRTVTTGNISVFFAGGRWFNRKLLFASKTLICQRPFCSFTCGGSSLQNILRNWLVNKDRTFYWLSVRSTPFRELGSSSETGQTDSSGDEVMDPYFEASYAKLGTSSCKKCKEKIEKGSLRLAKVTYVHKSDFLKSFWVRYWCVLSN